MAAKAKSETAARLTAILRGAFSGPPTPLKDIPKKRGDAKGVSRATSKKRAPRS